MSLRRRPLPSRHDHPPPSIDHFARWFAEQPNARERFRWALRDSLDELLDGSRTGRWCYQQLSKTEKTHLGTIVEVNLTKEFEISNGYDLDWSIDGADLDCKFSKDIGGWEIPMEMYVCEDHQDQSGVENYPALLVWMCDDTSEWAAGLFTARDDLLRWRTDQSSGRRLRAYNRDNKRRIDESGQREIYWLWGGVQGDLPENTLLHMDADKRDRILSPGASGQERVNALFRENLNQIMRRPIVLTVAQQDDGPKRPRDARGHLKSEGIVVLGHQEAHPEIARILGVDVPTKGEWISLRLAKVNATDPRRKVFLDDAFWVLAEANDAVVEAPSIPRHRLPPQPAGTT